MNEIENQGVIKTEGWFGRQICDEHYLPLPTYCLKEKKYDARTYAVLTALSYRSVKEKENMNQRYVYKNSFDVKELALSLGVNKTTLERSIKKLNRLDCNVLDISNTPNGIVYKLNYGKKVPRQEQVNKYITINHKMLIEMINVFNSNVIKVYCLLKFMTDEKTYKHMTNSWIAEQIGLSSTSKTTLQAISNITSALENCGYIETRLTNKMIWDENLGKEIPRINKSYRLKTYDEWLKQKIEFQKRTKKNVKK